MTDQDGTTPNNPLADPSALHPDRVTSGLRDGVHFGYANPDNPGAISPLTAAGRQALKSTVEGDFIPRLMLSHSVPPQSDAAHGGLVAGAIGVADEDVVTFNTLILNDADTEALGFVDLLLARGIPIETIYTDLFAVCARRLGEMWEADICSFAEVTLGLCRLHELLRAQGSTYDLSFGGLNDKPSILLGTLDGDNHIFGIAIVAEFFRRAHWRVQCAPGSDHEELTDYLRDQEVDILGLSLSGVTPEKAMRQQISTIRKQSRNTDLRIMVGGPVVANDPSIIARIGADDGSANARTAPSRAASLVAARVRHS